MYVMAMGESGNPSLPDGQCACVHNNRTNHSGRAPSPLCDCYTHMRIVHPTAMDRHPSPFLCERCAIPFVADFSIYPNDYNAINKAEIVKAVRTGNARQGNG